METEVVELSGHIIDSLLLGKVLDAIVEAGADYRMFDVEIGRTNTDTSNVHLEITARDRPSLEQLLENLQVHGVNRTLLSPARLVACDRDGVLPAGFYSTTNLPTYVLAGGDKIKVENPEMDCALVVRNERCARFRCTAPARAISSSSGSTASRSPRLPSPVGSTASNSCPPR